MIIIIMILTITITKICRYTINDEECGVGFCTLCEVSSVSSCVFLELQTHTLRRGLSPKRSRNLTFEKSKLQNQLHHTMYFQNPACRFQQVWDRWPWEVFANSPCLTGCRAGLLTDIYFLNGDHFDKFEEMCAYLCQMYLKWIHHPQSVQLRDQWGRSTNVPWKSNFRSLLQQDNPLVGLVSFSPSWLCSWLPALAHFNQSSGF